MAQTLETIISINARTGNGFSQVGATLSELGSMVNGLSQELINFGKDSIEVYRDYEKSMKDAEVALSTTYGRGTKELGTVMSQLDASATEWAATTIFHTNDVANAISEAAHAGWDYEQIMAGIPAAMQLAQAGGLDLSEAVNYIVKSTNAAGIGFEDMTDFIDLWTFAANSSASTIGEFGEAMLRMGSTMKFTDSKEELMTLIAITANAGSVGSEAGTMIRNSIMRLIAPTDKAEKAMAQLGATSEEAAGMLTDESLAAANAELAAHGFSAYDQDGNLKSVLETYKGLYLALGDIAGGYDNISKNQDALEILSAIFPTRTITEALNLLDAAADSYGGLYEAMEGGDAEGYGQYAADTMMDSLNGKIETFESKVERLKQLVGEELSGQVIDVLGGVGDIVDHIAELDDGKLGALVSGLEVIAFAGPGLLAAGTAMRFIGAVLSPAGAVGMGLITLGALVEYVDKLDQANFEGAFGLADLDHDAINGYVKSLGESFEQAYEQVNEFRGAVDSSIQSYQTASSTFSGNLLTDMLTGVELTEDDKTALYSLGEDMQTAVIDGIANSGAASASYFEMLFGGTDAAGNDPTAQNILGLIETSSYGYIEQAQQIGENLRSALTDAFADGTISEDEYQNILSYMQAYNDALAEAAAEAQNEQDYVNQKMLLHKAQTASKDEIDAVSKEIQEERDRVLQEEEDAYARERYTLEYRYDKAIEDGTEINGKKVTKSDKEAALSAVDTKHEQRSAQQSEQYDGILNALYESQLQQSDYAEMNEGLGKLADQVSTGNITQDTAHGLYNSKYNSGILGFFSDKLSFLNNDKANLSTYIGDWINALGGYDEINKKISELEASGKSEEAQGYKDILLKQQISDAGMSVEGKNIFGQKTTTKLPTKYEDVYGSLGNENGKNAYTVDDARSTLSTLDGGEINKLFETAGKLADELGGGEATNDFFEKSRELTKDQYNLLDDVIGNLKSTYDFDKIEQDTANGHNFGDPSNGQRDAYVANQLLNGGLNAEEYRINVIPEVDQSQIGNLDPVPLPIKPNTEGLSGDASIKALEEQNATVNVTGDTEQLSATIAAEDGQNLMEYVSGDASDLSMTIQSQDGKTLRENVTGDASSLAAIINSYNGRTITVNIQGQKLFASGGRATEASIFGEAGPEWAIPEEHSSRTANLLNAAREASGFTWPELLNMYGGLNAGANNSPSTIVYSPTINAQDVSGVESALAEDKERLDKWYKEKKMKDSLEVYQ